MPVDVREGKLSDRLSFWTDETYFPFWRRVLPVTVTVHGKQPTDEQLELLFAIIDHTTYLRPEVESRVLAYYQNSVYGSFTVYRDSVDVTEEYAPEVSNLAQLQKLMSPPTVWIDPDPTEDSEFSLMFGCDWDTEHGLEIEFRNFQMVDFG